MDKKENVLTKLFSSFKNMFARLFGLKKDDYVYDEELLSPRQIIFKNFMRNKLALLGLTVFTVMALTVTIGSALLPVKYTDNEPTLRNTAPGRNFLKVPSKLQNEGVAQIATGVSYSFGLSDEGNIYFWGVNTENVKEVPENVKNSKVTQIASGDRHVLALLDSGELVAWGYNSFEQGSIPLQISQAARSEGVQKLFAGDLYSGILTNKGTVYIWGSTLNNKLNIVPSSIQGRIVDVSPSANNVLFLLDDGTVTVNGTKGQPIEARIPEELKDGTVNVVDIAATSVNGLAIDANGKLYVWGTSSVPAYSLPQEYLNEKFVQIEGGLSHFVGITESGEIKSWGSTTHNQANASKLEGKTYDEIFVSYYQSYGVNSEGKADGFGFAGFLLGSDDWGRDIAIRLIHGGRITMFIGVVAVLISTVIGVTVGLIAGFYGGRIDNILMRFAEIVSSFPFLPLAITLSTMLVDKLDQSQRLLLVMAILGIIAWPGLARMIRGQILAEREKDFVLAARALGLTTPKVIMKHILPAVFNIIIVNMTLSYAGNLLTESGLSFLGFGVSAPQPSWGNMLTGSQSTRVIEFYWWQWVLPAMSVLLAALSVNLVGDGLREAMDPRANEK